MQVKLDHLLIFFQDRLKVQLREQGARHDLFDAVFSYVLPASQEANWLSSFDESRLWANFLDSR